MTAYDMIRAVEGQRNLHGNGYIAPSSSQVARTGEKSADFADRFKTVQIWIDDKELFGKRNRVWYVVRAVMRR